MKAKSSLKVNLRPKIAGGVGCGWEIVEWKIQQNEITGGSFFVCFDSTGVNSQKKTHLDCKRTINGSLHRIWKNISKSIFFSQI